MACQHAVKIEQVYHQTCILQAALYGLFSQAEGGNKPPGQIPTLTPMISLRCGSYRSRWR